MRIINIVDDIALKNYGIWNASISSSDILKVKYQVVSEIWFPSLKGQKAPDYIRCRKFPLPSTKTKTIDTLIQSQRVEKEDTVIVTHGSWQFPTWWGHEFNNHGYKWVYVPHGMLEPWSMHQKWFKKTAYFKFFENKMAKKADLVRAVGRPELKNLELKYKNTILIPNGTEIFDYSVDEKNYGSNFKILFLGRLHFKKGVVKLVEAWKLSKLFKNPRFELIIAGPDDGELKGLMKSISEIKEKHNINYLGALYENSKIKILKQSHFFILPSLSEGFPTSVVEAMQFGLIPLITDGCNFPETFENKLAIKISNQVEDIVRGLNSLENFDPSNLHLQADRCRKFIDENYSLERIADKQYETYSKLLI